MMMESPRLDYSFRSDSSGQQIGNIKDVLEDNRSLLTRNIILTEEFFNLLRQEKILSETMIKDVQKEETQDAKNAQLLETFRLISTNKVMKFVGILQKTGHHFLYEFVNAQLEERLSDDSDHVYVDVFKKIPALDRSLSATVKHQLANYIQEKIKEERVKLSWRVAPREKEKVMKAKVQLIEQAIAHKDEIVDKEKKVRSVEDKLGSALERLQETEKEVMELRNEFNENNDKHLGTIKTLNNFTHASEAEIDRLKERMGIFDSQVRRMNFRVRTFLKQDDPEFTERIKADPDNVRLSVLERNIEMLIQAKLGSDKKITGLNHAQKDVRSLVMKSVGRRADDLVSALHIFREENEREKQTILGQVDTMERILTLGQKIETGEEIKDSIAIATTVPQQDVFHRWREIADFVNDKVIQLDNLMGRLAIMFKRSPSKRAIAVVSPTIDYRNFVAVMEIDKQPKSVLPPIKSPVLTPRHLRKPRPKLSEPRQRQAPGNFIYSKTDSSRSTGTSTGTRSPSPSKSIDRLGDHRLSLVEMAFPDMTAPVSGRVLKGVHVKKSNSMELNKKKYDLDFFDKTASGIGQN